MAEERVTLDQLLKDGDAFEFNKIDYSSESFSKAVVKLKKKQKEILKSAEVDLNELSRIYFVR